MLSPSWSDDRVARRRRSERTEEHFIMSFHLDFSCSVLGEALMSKFSKSDEAVAQCVDGIHVICLSILNAIPLYHYCTSMQRRHAFSSR